jgi:hypothetical protein
MVRSVNKIVLVLTVLIGSPSALGNATIFAESSVQVDLTRTDAATPVYASAASAGISRPTVSDAFALLREVKFQDSSTRLAVTRVATRERLQGQDLNANAARSEPNLNAMLIMGLGIALISMVRRLKRI